MYTFITIYLILPPQKILAFSLFIDRKIAFIVICLRINLFIYFYKKWIKKKSIFDKQITKNMIPNGKH